MQNIPEFETQAYAWKNLNKPYGRLGWDPREKYSHRYLYIDDNQRLLKAETAKRKEIMQQIIKSRGVEFQESK